MIYLFLLITALIPNQVLAQNPFGEYVDKMANVAGYNVAGTDEYTLSRTLGLITFTFLSFLGTLFIILIIYGGIRWMVARGNEEEVNFAKKVIRNSLIGLVIVFSSMAIYITISKILF